MQLGFLACPLLECPVPPPPSTCCHWKDLGQISVEFWTLAQEREGGCRDLPYSVAALLGKLYIWLLNLPSAKLQSD